MALVLTMPATAQSAAVQTAPQTQASPSAQTETLTGPKALGDWTQDAPGVRRLLTLADMPAAQTTASAQNSADKTNGIPDGARPKVPPGFQIEMVASGIKNPRAMRLAPNGDIFIADSMANQVLVYRPGTGGGAAKPQVFATGLYKPYGIAFYPVTGTPQWVYIANADGIVRFPYKPGETKAAGKPEPIVQHVPATHHWTRDIVFSPDGKTLYMSVGSGSNVALDMSKTPMGGLDEWNKSHPLGAAWDTEENRADVLAFDPDGKNQRVFAAGLRNCAGMTMQPATGQLWCVVNERDELGDDVPFEYATHVEQGKFYGWPWFYIGGNEDFRHKGERPDLADKVTVPDVLFQAHSAPLGIAFNTGDAFGAQYKGDAFVTFHGSWNRGQRTGYKVVRMIFKDGKPTGEYEDFITGFVVNDKEVWGRPVGIAFAKDGSMYLSEDGNGTIWRVTHNTTVGSR